MSNLSLPFEFLQLSQIFFPLSSTEIISALSYQCCCQPLSSMQGHPIHCIMHRYTLTHSSQPLPMLDALICINTHKLICPTGQHNTLVENKSLPPQPRATLIRRVGISSTTAFCTARIFPVSLMRAVTKKWKEACSNMSLMYSLDLITMSKELAEGRHRKEKRRLKESNHYLLLPSWPVPVTWVPGKKKWFTSQQMALIIFF